MSAGGGGPGQRESACLVYACVGYGLAREATGVARSEPGWAVSRYGARETAILV
jgi:hypothetical protein